MRALTQEEYDFMTDYNQDLLRPWDPRWTRLLVVADKLVADGYIVRRQLFSFFGEKFGHEITDLGRLAVEAHRPETAVPL
jgi:hypothetical protein